jgi:hypothetical protein
MEAIMIAGVAVVAVSGWYSAADMLADFGIRLGKRSKVMKSCRFSGSAQISAQRGIKQMAGVNI